MATHAHKPARRFGRDYSYNYAVCTCGVHLVGTFTGWQPALTGSRAYQAARVELEP